MKKKYVVGIILLVLIIIIAVSFVIYNSVIGNGRKYEIEQVKEFNYFALKQNNQYGVIDKTGNTILNSQYDEVKIPNPEKAVFVCSKSEEIKILNDKNEEIFTRI